MKTWAENFTDEEIKIVEEKYKDDRHEFEPDTDCS